MKRVLNIVIMLLITVLVLAACTEQGAPSEEKSITVTDQKNREITVEGNVEKIVSLAPSNTEILFALGLGDKIVGVTDYCNYPAEAGEIEKMGGFEGANVERIIEAAPDVVFSTTVSQETVETLDLAGIAVIVIDPQSFDNVYDGIRIIGQVCGVESAAVALVNSMKDSITTITDKLSAIALEDRKVVYYEIWHDPPMTVGPNTFLNEVLNMAGVFNLAADAESDWPTYSSEVILEKNPDVILLGHGGQGAEEVASRPGWATINAVKNQRVVAIDADIFSRPGPRIVEAIQFLAEYAYPDLFGK